MPTNSVSGISNSSIRMKRQSSGLIKKEHPNPNRRTKMSIEAIAWKQLIALMCTRQVCRREMREHTGLSQTTINRWLAVLHTRPRNLIYISEYKRSATVGPYTEYYSFGFCEYDVPRPAALTKVQRNKRARIKAAVAAIPKQPGVITHVTSDS